MGARDTLRLEAANLYGQEIDKTVSLSRQHGLDYPGKPANRDFIGRKTMEVQREHRTEKLVGLVMTGKRRAA
ncbi:hypothetical protein ACNKHX_17545 [Shigella flexneri]